MKTLRNYWNETKQMMKAQSGKFCQMAKVMLTGVAMASTLTSCELGYYEYGPGHMDYQQSKALSGEWTGDFGMYYSYNGRYFDADYTDVVFYPARYGATYGYGKQVDWYSWGPYEYIYHKFDWQLVDGVVELRYYSDSNLNTFIRDYKMTNDYFEGYFGNSSDRFRLRKIVDHYDWTPYVNTYSYGDRRDWYGSARQMFEFGDSVSTQTQATDSIAQAGEGITFGNRFLDAERK